jgi:ferredoxin
MDHRLEIGDGFAVDVPAGRSLLEICEEHDAPVPFDCRGGACGTCLVQVVAGASNLSPLTDNEVIMLEELGSTSGDLRLACQLRVLGPVTLRPVGPG